jgi:citrate lyase subunit beta / citryl-CoA lyase
MRLAPASRSTTWSRSCGPASTRSWSPKTNGAADVEKIANYLDALEARAGMTPGSVKLAVVATERAKVFALGSYAPAHPRLAALTWGGEDLAAAVGASANRDEDGAWTFPYQVARAQCLFAASAADVAAIDTVFVDFRDLEGFEHDCRISRRDGFSGRMAIHPDQVAAINRCYAPSDAEVERAQKIVAAFEANPGAGALGIDGQMVDIPHLKAARKILASLRLRQILLREAGKVAPLARLRGFAVGNAVFATFWAS